MMLIAVGDGAAIAGALPELNRLLRRPLATLERIRVCKRDGERLAEPHALPRTDGAALLGYATTRLQERLPLAEAGHVVRCLVRDRGTPPARALERRGLGLHEGDVLRAESLRGAGRGMDVAYYLIHSMGRGGPVDFAASERAAATAFARMARAEGIERVIYLGGLGARNQRICAAGRRPRSRSPSTVRR